MSFTYKQCRKLNKFLSAANEKIQNYRPLIFARDRCLFCRNMISHDFLTGSNYCSIGGFRIKPRYICDLFDSYENRKNI